VLRAGLIGGGPIKRNVVSKSKSNQLRHKGALIYAPSAPGVKGVSGRRAAAPGSAIRNAFSISSFSMIPLGRINKLLFSARTIFANQKQRKEAHENQREREKEMHRSQLSPPNQ
jgi:hypothetical protein